MCIYYDLINKTDVEIFRIYGHTTRLPEIQLSSGNRQESDMADSPDLFNFKIRGERFADFLFTLQSGSGTTA